MANWCEDAARTLLEIARQDPGLAKILRGMIQQIEDNLEERQKKDTFGFSTFRVYTNATYRFRVVYRYEDGQSLDIVTIGRF